MGYYPNTVHLLELGGAAGAATFLTYWVAPDSPPPELADQSLPLRGQLARVTKSRALQASDIGRLEHCALRVAQARVPLGWPRVADAELAVLV
eukprot:COSAG05_NODE_2623_length_2830_cov_5.340901_1_plen_93_part_00